MKQHITIEQWQELSLRQQRKFQEVVNSGGLPNIGQMIEYISSIWSDPCIDSHDSEGWLVYNTADDSDVYEEKELCNALWQIVKSDLEK